MTAIAFDAPVRASLSAARAGLMATTSHDLLTSARPSASVPLEDIVAALPEGEVTAPGDRSPTQLGVGAFLDPGLLLMALQSELRASGATLAELQAEGSAQRSEIAHAERREALEKAEKAGKRAQRLLHRAPPWIKKLVAGVISAVGVVASAYTGGASLGLAIAGATLLLASDGIVKGLEAAGVDPKRAGLVGVALKLTGALLMSVSGVGASDAVPAAIQSAGTVAQVVDATNQAVEGSQEIAHAVIRGRAQSHLGDADAAGVNAAEAEEALARATEDLGDVLQLFARAASRAARISAAVGDARLAAVSMLA